MKEKTQRNGKQRALMVAMAAGMAGTVWGIKKWRALQQTPPVGIHSHHAGLAGYYQQVGRWRIFTRATAKPMPGFTGGVDSWSGAVGPCNGRFGHCAVMGFPRAGARSAGLWCQRDASVVADADGRSAGRCALAVDAAQRYSPRAVYRQLFWLSGAGRVSGAAS